MILEFKELIEEAIKKVKQGDKYAYPVFIELKDLVNFLTDAIEQIEEEVIEEVEDGKMQYGGYEIQKFTKDFIVIKNLKQ